MEFPTLPDNIRLNRTCNDLKAWILGLDAEEAKIVAAPVESLINLDAAYPKAQSKQEQIANYIEVTDSNSWDPPRPTILYRIGILIILLERGFARPFSTASAGDEKEAAARAEPRLAKLRKSWEALRAGTLSQQWLAEPYGRDDQPFEGPGEVYPPILKDAASATASVDPTGRTQAWFESMDEENFNLAVRAFMHALPEPLLPRKGMKAHFASFFAGAERGSAAPGNGYIYDRALVLAYIVEGQFRMRFNGDHFDQDEKLGNALKSGEKTYKDIFPPEAPIPEDLQKEFAEMLVAGLETLPARRAVAQKLGAEWDALMAEDLADNRLRLWCAKTS